MKTVQCAFTQPATLTVGDAVDLDYADGVVGQATIVQFDGAGTRYRLTFAAEFANDRYVLAGNVPYGASGSLVAAVKRTNDVDVLVSDTTAGLKVDLVLLGD